MKKTAGARLVLLASCCVAINVAAEKIYFPINGYALSGQRAATIDCANQMHSILRAAQTWSLDNADMFPVSLQQMTNELGAPFRLYCPAVFHSEIPTNWSSVNWAEIDYQWLPASSSDPTNLVCECRAHALRGLVEGSVHGSGYRAGWPLVTASPMNVYATPGEQATLALRVAPDSVLPVSFQWRACRLEYLTNAVQVENPEVPGQRYWVTNVIPRFIGTNVPGGTNASLLLTSLAPSPYEWYDVVISNSMGVTLTHPARLNVQASPAGLSTNGAFADALCRNNLVNIYLLARFMDSTGLSLMPDNLSVMTNVWGEPLFGWPSALFCRADTNHVPPEAWAEVDFEKISYDILPGPYWSAVEVFCRCRVHGYYVSVDGVPMLNPVFTGITNRSDGAVDIGFRTFAGKENLLEFTEDWNNWQTQGSYGTDAAEVRVVDQVVSSQRFYRIQLR